MPPLEVEFEVVAFSPFIPGIDENDGVGEAIEGGAISQYRTKPVAV